MEGHFGNILAKWGNYSPPPRMVRASRQRRIQGRGAMHRLAPPPTSLVIEVGARRK